MLSKSKIKLVRSLENKKYRKQSGLFTAEGRKILLEILQGSRFKIEEIFLLHKSFSGFSSWLSKDIKTSIITKKELCRISTFKTVDFGLAVLRLPQETVCPVPAENELFLLFDNIGNPGNLGTIIRLCDWFNIPHIICSEDSADVFSPKVIQSSMGSFNRVSVHYTNPQLWLETLPKNIMIYGMFLNGKSLKTVIPHRPSVIVFGNESHGISDKISRYITEKITIPSAKQAGAESLNVATAAAIAVYHFSVNK